MQEQIKILTSKVTKLGHRDSNKEQQSSFKNHQETEPESVPPPPPTTSPRMCSILLRNDIMFHSQNPKDSAGNRVVTKSVLKEVTHRIQNTMQALIVFEKRLHKQQNTIQTM